MSKLLVIDIRGIFFATDIITNPYGKKNGHFGMHRMTNHV